MIELTDVTKRFGDNVAVDDVSLTIPEGELTILLGPSGCGKTTTLRAINRMTEIDAGEILLAGPSDHRHSAARAAPPHRLRDPERRPVPQHDGRAQHRHRAAAAGLGQGPHRERS